MAVFLAGAAFCLLFNTSCGYHLAGNQIGRPDAPGSLSIPVLKNVTTSPQVEQVFTRALREQFSERTSMRITSQASEADWLLEGTIISLSSTPILFGKEGFANTFLLTVQASIKITQKKDGKVILNNTNFLFRDQYQINSQVRQFFSEQNPALARIARDFAASVYALFRENLS